MHMLTPTPERRPARPALRLTARLASHLTPRFKSRLASRLLLAASVLAAAAGAAHAPAALAQARTTLTVYTTLEKEQLAPYKAAFEKAHPEIQIAWLRDSPGIILARLIAEKDAPKADLLWGVPSMHILALNKLGLIQPYEPKGYAQLKPRFRDTANKPPVYTGNEAWMTMICFNTVEAKKRNLPAPVTWSDLAKPIYRGQITMPNPVSSQTGYLGVNHWVQSMGEDAAWKYMDGLHANIALYTHSGSKPCKLAATGEYVIGISTDITAPQLKSKGAPIDIIVPADKLGWDIESTAIMKGTPRLAAAKVVADWMTTREANEQFNKFMAVVSHPDVRQVPPNYPPNAEAMMADDNVARAVENQTRLTNEWTRRYDGKSEPKPN
nr:putative 2-aminoethylphosphonate ABC transporter substrate-binding protein [Cupriavidus sp. WS]